MSDESRPTRLLQLVPALTLNMAIALAAAIPLTGVLIRYRANYSPKVVQLEGDDVAAQGRKGPAVSGYFSMLARVYRLEGWAGLYKGTMPAVLVSLVAITYHAIRFIILGNASLPGAQPLTEVGIWTRLGRSVLWMLVMLPVTILSSRAITTPYKLPFFGLKQSLHTLLTPTERSRPWVLYLTPGLMVATSLEIVVTVVSIMCVERNLLPELPKSREAIDAMFILKSLMYLAAVVISTTVVVPLEVMKARLAIQRNHASYDSLPSQEERRAALGEPPVYPRAVNEDVIGFRDEADPYTSFIDCAKRMIGEEGWSTMFRAWWISFLPLLAAGISMMFVEKKV
ncbi:putative mitochondrial carrier (TC 2.A.29) family protein [Lyophyllum shimeji]|uniref:Mitochondrial carrier (TC 2.A.29) family protein n=1 Tax=Lyophyllum shimeji TaxID=47721 RepID=A0A9P3PQQ8_LYOSH|nr:putative mitochondrial carrier (TC 2.A.29) family protein [Lyophyllum shimeji]